MTAEALIALQLALRLCLGIWFLSAAIGKLAQYQSFVRGVMDYQLLSPWASRILSRVLPWIEITFGIALITGVLLPVTTIGVCVLLVTFTYAAAANVIRGRSIACNCHGLAATRTVGWGTIARNTSLLVMAALAGVISASTAHGEAVVLLGADVPVLTSASSLLVTSMLAAWCLLFVYLVD